MEKGIGGKWIVFAFQDEGGTNPGEPVTGDAANITANVRIDGGAANAVDDTNPTELEDGYYIFDITAAESNGDLLLITPASATANVNVIGVPGAIYTTPPNFNAMGIESDGDLTQVNNCVANTDMRGTDSAATATALATVDSNVDAILLDTAEIGAAGAGLTALATQASVNTIDGIVDDILVDTATTIPALIAALNDPSVADILTTQMTESYAANGTAPTLAQALFAIHQHLMDFTITGTARSVKQLDSATEAFSETLNDATTPTGLERV